MNKILILGCLCVCIMFSMTSCTTEKTDVASDAEPKETKMDFEKPRVPAWHKNATIYEVNLRHYTSEGTFKAFEASLPRLKDMGVDILWFMPIHEISKTKRKGILGSPYAVNNYTEVNPDFGTMDDFKNLLSAIHSQGMYCIIDWVPNHTGWDNPWITEHPDWFSKDADGNITDPINYDTGESWGWTDVADLDYSNQEMRAAMIDAMAFWISDVGIDGFRVDVAHGVPADFWDDATDALYAIEPVFMLAESEIPGLLNSGAFVMDYAWEMHHLLNDIAKSQGVNKDAQKLEKGNVVEGDGDDDMKKTALDIDRLLKKKSNDYKKGYQMHFTSNHDENAWAGTEMTRFGDGHKTFAVLTATFDGMPLLYTGMESAFDKQLEFFKKDEIDWGDYAYADFYRTLFSLKHRNIALWNGEHGGDLVKIPTGNDEHMYCFSREKNGDKVVVMLNLSSSEQIAVINDKKLDGAYMDLFEDKEVAFMGQMKLTFEPWEYRVYERK